MIILDIGCGEKKQQNAIGLDKFKTQATDILCDIDAGLPFKDNSADVVIMDNVLEHVNDVIATIEEIYRVLKVGGQAVITVPHVAYLGAFQDPTHKHFFTIMTMDYFTEESSFNYYSYARFKILRKELKFEPKWLQWLFNRRPEFTERLLGIIPVKANIYWILEKNKSGKSA